jgi:hypothetical protein
MTKYNIVIGGAGPGITVNKYLMSISLLERPVPVLVFNL